jgi:hypothetical protein
MVRYLPSVKNFADIFPKKWRNFALDLDWMGDA